MAKAPRVLNRLKCFRVSEEEDRLFEKLKAGFVDGLPVRDSDIIRMALRALVRERETSRATNESN